MSKHHFTYEYRTIDGMFLYLVMSCDRCNYLRRAIPVADMHEQPNKPSWMWILDSYAMLLRQFPTCEHALENRPIKDTKPTFMPMLVRR